METIARKRRENKKEDNEGKTGRHSIIFSKTTTVVLVDQPEKPEDYSKRREANKLCRGSNNKQGCFVLVKLLRETTVGT